MKKKWGCLPILLVIIVLGVISGDDDDDERAIRPFYVAADVLNVRASPSASAPVVTQVTLGTAISPEYVSGEWYGVTLTDGSIGWIHSDYLGTSSVR